jgi:4-amino-4-deoxy-L-arabinose transferase-like glycosyltransferase
VAEKEITIEIKRPEVLILIGILFFFFIQMLLVSLQSPINFGDEGFHTRLAQYIYEEREYPTYIWFEGSDILRDGYFRPPLWNLLQASFFIFGSYDLMTKILTPSIVFVMGIAIFLFVKRLYNEVVGFIASIIAITLPSLVTYSVLFYDVILVTFYSALFFLTFLLSFKENNKKYFFLSAIFFALAFLSKRYGQVLLAFLPLAFLYEYYGERKLLNFKIFKKYLIFLLIFAGIVFPFLLRNLYYYHSFEFIIKFSFGEDLSRIDKFEEKYQFAGRVAEVGTEMNAYKMGITNVFDFMYGFLFFVPLAFFAGIAEILLKRDKIETFILIGIFLMIPLFHHSSPRAEDVARYMLGFIPLVAIVGGKYLESIFQFLKKYHFILATTFLVLIVCLGYLNLNNKLKIMERVKQFSPAFFEACEWVKQNPDKVPKDALLYTIWSHRSIYACQRNSIGNLADVMLSKDLNYTLNVLKAHKITHLFIQKFSIDPQNNHYAENYDADFVQFLEDNPKAFVKIYENGPSFNLTNRSIRDWVYYCYQTIGTICDGNVIYEVNYTYLM